MSEERLIFYNDADGKWELYDGAYDITIHCKTQQEQDRAVELLRKARQTAKEAIQPEDMARILQTYCKSRTTTADGCADCCFSGGKTCCKLGSIPENWDV